MTYRALGCGCGCAGTGGCGGLGTGATASTLSPAGEINGIATLAYDVHQLTTDLAARWGNTPIVLNRGMYRGLLARAGRQQLTRMTGIEVRQLVTGVVGDVGDAIVRARQLALIGVGSERDRALNHAAQAALIGPARLMWDATGELFRLAQPMSEGTGGLGVIPVAIIIAVAVVGIILGLAAIAAATYLFDSQARLAEAKVEADRICRRSGGCTTEQYTRLRRELAAGPFDDAIRSAGEGFGDAVTITLIAGGAVIAGLAAWGGWKIWKARRTVTA